MLALTHTVWFCQRGKCDSATPFTIIFPYCPNLLRDGVSGLLQRDIEGRDNKKALRRMQLFTNVLFVLENLVMTLLHYFSQHSNNWYSLPVTDCACVFSVLGAVIRVKLYHFLYKDLGYEIGDSHLINSNNSRIDVCRCWISTV